MLDAKELAIKKLQKRVRQLEREIKERLDDKISTRSEAVLVESVKKVRLYAINKALGHMTALPMCIEGDDGDEMYYLELSKEQYEAIMAAENGKNGKE